MSSEKQNRQMQEAIDAELEPSAYKKLMENVKNDPEASAQYGHLQNIDGMMREARTRPAPSSLAQGIMAKIASKEGLPKPLTSGRSLALGLGISTVVILPLLVGISIAILNAFGAGTALSGAALWITGLAVFAYSLLTGFAGTAEQLIVNNPLIFSLLLLIPVAWFGLWRLGKSWSGVRHE